MAEGLQLQVRVLDVFTARPLAGNPLGVVLGAESLDGGAMQAIAKEFNLSSTAFVLAPTAEGATYRIRIFTPTHELRFAGHPVIGTAWLLAEDGIIPLQGDKTSIQQQVAIGTLPVAIYASNGRPIKIVMTQGRPELGETYHGSDAALLATALGLSAADLRSDLPIQVASTGIPSLMVPLRDLDALARVDLDTRALRAVPGIAELSRLYTFVHDGDNARARFFAPKHGISEDPATGSAAGGLGAYLYAHLPRTQSDTPLRLRVDQGIEMGRPSEIEVEVWGDSSAREVRVGGAAVTVMRGELRI